MFALYVTGYSAFRIFEETQRIDPAHHFLGERLNFWVACLAHAGPGVVRVDAERAPAHVHGQRVARRAARRAAARAAGRPP